MKLQNKTLAALFVAGFISPILAFSVLPADYSFYMFLPATPDTTINQFRLHAANALLVLGFAIAIITALTLAIR